jgi:hypothetical protein
MVGLGVVLVGLLEVSSWTLRGETVWERTCRFDFDLLLLNGLLLKLDVGMAMARWFGLYWNATTPVWRFAERSSAFSALHGTKMACFMTELC